MIESPDLEATAVRYREFAEYEASGSCDLYASFADSAANSEKVLTFLASLPLDRRQPNLLLASVRWVGGLASNGEEFCELVEAHSEELRSTMLERSTQTNEPARCATLLPILSDLPQPLALIEVGASAGLCLLPDRFSYSYGNVNLRPPDAGDLIPEFECVLVDGAGAPSRLPEVIWRRGLDLNPLDLSSPEDVRWLQTLVWPSHRQRMRNLERAILLARVDPPRVERGDLLTDLHRLLDSAPKDATRVVFHSAVLNYVEDPDTRVRFGESVMERGAVWVSNEGPSVLPSITARVPGGPRRDRFILSVNGEPVAQTGFHGQTFEWLVDWSGQGTV